MRVRVCYAAFAVCLLFGLLSVGCLKSSDEVIVYCALDREFSEPILQRFTEQTGIPVRAKYDSESTKTVGLVNRIIAESKQRTRCDLFWNNEIVNTMRLDARPGMLAEQIPAQVENYPAAFRSSRHRWFGFAARARVLIVNTQIVPAEAMPNSIYDLLEPKWKGKTAIAKPLFGSTATHAVCLFEALGEEKAKEFFQGLKDNEVQVVSGNKQVAEDVAAGKIAFGLTDTDDAIIEKESGFPVEIIYPDSRSDQIGTLFIPNTLCLPSGSPNPSGAQELLNFLLQPEVEIALANGESAQIPLHREVQVDLRVESPNTVHAMEVDFEAAAKRWDDVGEFVKQTLSLM